MTPTITTIKIKLTGWLGSPWLPPLTVFFALLAGDLALRAIVWLYLIHFLLIQAPRQYGHGRGIQSPLWPIEKFVNFSVRWGAWVIISVVLLVLSIILTHKLGA